MHYVVIIFVFTDINECASKPCENGATCKDEVNAYSCVCAEGYTGVDCETGLGFSLICQTCVFIMQKMYS